VSGTLYIVSTPIGNLEDITLRAVRILGEVSVIAAEDTRTSGNLLKHLNIPTRLVSYHSHNEHRRSDDLTDRLLAGESVAIVTDAGTPGISDPAYVLIKKAIDAGVAVIPVPGPSAVLPALVVSGLPTDRFVFEGFLPMKKGRQTKWKMLAEEERTIVLYESPHRVLAAIEEITVYLGDRRIAVVRELTKKFEEVVRGRATEVLERLKARDPRGEYVIVIAGRSFRES
jgi:16S rRNA (cytidine1402-2'-O)-methyltransferase